MSRRLIQDIERVERLEAEIERLRAENRNLRGPDRVLVTPEIVEAPISSLIEQLRDEIAWLRSLITEWADAEDVMNTVRLDAAEVALRKAVGR